MHPVGLVPRDALLDGRTAAGAGSFVELGVDTAGLTTASARPAVEAVRQWVRDTVRSQAPDLDRTHFETSLEHELGRADLVGSVLTGTVVPLATAGALTGLLIALAAGAFWVERRRGELTMLSARGVGPGALAGKAVLETLGVLAVGASAGWACAHLLIDTVGPVGLTTPSADRASLFTALAAFGASVLALATAAGVRAGRLHDTRPGRGGWVRRVPWELGLLVAAGACWLLLDGDVAVSDTTVGTVAHIPPRLLVTPVLGILGAGILGARALTGMLPRLPARDLGRRGLACTLALRRVRATPAIAAVLVAATAVPVALSLYGATVTGSVQRTLAAETGLTVGSDAVYALENTPAALLSGAREYATVVRRWDAGRLGDTTVHVLVHADLLDELVPTARAELWVRGDPDERAALLRDLDLPAAPIAVAEDIQARGVYGAITHTFGFLAAVSVSCGVVAVLALVLYLDARSRARRGAYVLLRRLGVGPVRHWWATVVEVGALLGAALLFGVLLAGAVVSPTAAGYDVNPGTAPDALLDPPWGLAAGLTAAVTVVAVLASLLAQRTVSRADPEEVLRDTR